MTFEKLLASISSSPACDECCVGDSNSPLDPGESREPESKSSNAHHIRLSKKQGAIKKAAINLTTHTHKK
jgi:hypothetical protein